MYQGKAYTRKVNMTKVTYSTSNGRLTRRGALIDRGANGGIAGGDVRIIHKSGNFADV